MKKGIFIFLLGLGATFFVACSKSDDPVEEFVNWKENNESYFNSLFSQTSQRIAAGDNSWRIIRKWSLQENVQVSNDNYVIAHVLENGDGADCPLFTDSVAVIYSGRLLPSTSYPTGLVFEKSYVGDFLVETALARGFRISSTSLIDGFATVLQQMHCGDRWEVYIPAAMGYGEVGNSSAGIPGHSVLIFDMKIKDIYHKK